MRFTVTTAAILLAAANAHAAILQVGAGKTYTTIARAAEAARDGDTIHIFPGTYGTGAVFRANGLTIMAAPGSAPGAVVVTSGEVDAKGLFVIKGADATVDNIRFNHAKVSSANGAGIRAEGQNLTVRNSRFTANEMGILITPAVAGGSYVIENSLFERTAAPAGHMGHGVYATGNVGTLTVRGSRFITGVKGHYIKSRAQVTTVENNVIDDSSGSASYLVNVAEGGAATIRGNQMTKGANASNCCIGISYGEEMAKGGTFVNAPGPVLIADNVFTNKSRAGVKFVRNASSPANPVVLAGNSLIATAGSLTALSGPGTVDGVAQLDALVGLLERFGDAAADEGDAEYTLAAAPAQVPAPGGLALALLGVAGVAAARRARR